MDEGEEDEAGAEGTDTARVVAKLADGVVRSGTVGAAVDVGEMDVGEMDGGEMDGGETI